MPARLLGCLAVSGQTTDGTARMSCKARRGRPNAVVPSAVGLQTTWSQSSEGVTESQTAASHLESQKQLLPHTDRTARDSQIPPTHRTGKLQEQEQATAMSCPTGRSLRYGGTYAFSPKLLCITLDLSGAALLMSLEVAVVVGGVCKAH